MTKPLALLFYEKLLPGSQLANRLQDEGWRVQTLNDPTALVHAAEEHKPMVALADLASSSASVTEYIAALRRHEPPAYLSDAAKKQFKFGQEIYFREGHCVTCHQPNGAGLDPAFPSIASSPWVTTDRDRLIKIAMYGLMGPLKVGNKEYNGQVPMTPFGGMLKDEEIASVLTFVRNHFGNKADPITAAEVKAIRDANPGRMMLYTTDELLKQHPMK